MSQPKSVGSFFFLDVAKVHLSKAKNRMGIEHTASVPRLFTHQWKMKGDEKRLKAISPDPLSVGIIFLLRMFHFLIILFDITKDKVHTIGVV